MDAEEVEADEWEISPTDITLDEKIGEGAFGTVYGAFIKASVIANSLYAKQKGGAALLVEKTPKIAVKLLKGKLIELLKIIESSVRVLFKNHCFSL